MKKLIIIAGILAVTSLTVFPSLAFADSPQNNPEPAATSSSNPDNTNITIHSTGDSDINLTISIDDSELRNNINQVSQNVDSLQNSLTSALPAGWASDFTQNVITVNKVVLPQLDSLNGNLNQLALATANLIKQGSLSQQDIDNLQGLYAGLSDSLSKQVNDLDAVITQLKNGNQTLSQGLSQNSDNINALQSRVQALQAASESLQTVNQNLLGLNQDLKNQLESQNAALITQNAATNDRVNSLFIAIAVVGGILLGLLGYVIFANRITSKSSYGFKINSKPHGA